MPLVFGFDIGTTSVGFAVIEHDSELATGTIHRLGVRIFPEARDPKGVPLNQELRQARLRRRQLRRRREHRRLLGDRLRMAGLLPSRHSPDWGRAMKRDPNDLRRRAFEGETPCPHEIGRAIFHLAQRRHFRGRDIDEVSDTGDEVADDADDKRATSARLLLRLLPTVASRQAAAIRSERVIGEPARRTVATLPPHLVPITVNRHGTLHVVASRYVAVHDSEDPEDRHRGRG